jgi:BASS family bile acid:Na+ symporter
LKTLTKINRTLNKCMPIITPSCLVFGVLFPQITSHFLPYVVALFAFMTFQGSLGSSFHQFGKVFQNPLPLLVILAMLHLLMPCLARVLGGALFGFDSNLVAGIVLEYVIPTGIVSFMWVSIYGGSGALTLSVILVDTLLAPLLVPLSLKLLLGTSVQVDAVGMMKDMVLMVAIPAVAGMLVNQLSHGKANDTLKPALAPLGKVALILVVSGNSSRVAPFIRHLTPVLVGTAVLMLCLSASGYLWGWFAAKVLHQPKPTLVSMTYNSGMRNISAGAVLAGSYFPPEVMFPVMISTLFQQILAAIFGVLLQKRVWKGSVPEEA